MISCSITPSPLGGTVTVPLSKSAAHRAIICAVLADGESFLSPACHSEDIDATLGAVKALGAKITETEQGFQITGIGNSPAKTAEINCRESGSTLRFLIPVAAAFGCNTLFTGGGRLPERPIDSLTEQLEAHGVACDGNHLPLTISGKLMAGEYSLAGNISSQYLTGLLLSLPVLKQDSRITLTTPLLSAGYVDMTLDTMRQFGVTVIKENNRYLIDSASKYTAHNQVIEGDWSHACFYIAAAAIGSNITIKGLLPTSKQGDMAAVEIFRRFGANVEFLDDDLVVSKGELTGITVDASQIPDMVPAIAVTAAFAKGKTVIHSAARLRLKESDRLKETAIGLAAMGISVQETADGLEITGGEPKGAEIRDANDHRIVMAFAVAAAYAKGNSTIHGIHAINKSYPHFFKDFNLLGGISNVI